jgi:hypothetical protein
MKTINKKKKQNLITFQKKMSIIFETSQKKIELNKKISEFESFDSLKVFEIINFFSNEKIDINPNKINDKVKFIDLFKYYDK